MSVNNKIPPRGESGMESFVIPPRRTRNEVNNSRRTRNARRVRHECVQTGMRNWPRFIKDRKLVIYTRPAWKSRGPATANPISPCGQFVLIPRSWLHHWEKTRPPFYRKRVSGYTADPTNYPHVLTAWVSPSPRVPCMRFTHPRTPWPQGCGSASLLSAYKTLGWKIVWRKRKVFSYLEFFFFFFFFPVYLYMSCRSGISPFRISAVLLSFN